MFNILRGLRINIKIKRVSYVQIFAINVFYSVYADSCVCHDGCFCDNDKEVQISQLLF
jgi:hypothetical protein